MTDHGIKVVRKPQPFPCDYPDCLDYTEVPKGIRCVHWDFWDGCKLKRVLYGVKAK